MHPAILRQDAVEPAKEERKKAHYDTRATEQYFVINHRVAPPASARREEQRRGNRCGRTGVRWPNLAARRGAYRNCGKAGASENRPPRGATCARAGAARRA